MEYPAMLYRPNGTMLDWDGGTWDYLIVADEDEEAVAREEGFGLPGEEQAEQPKRGRPRKVTA